MVKSIFILGLLAMSACGVKKAPTPLYSIPETALTTKPSPTPESSPAPSPTPAPKSKKKKK